MGIYFLDPPWKGKFERCLEVLGVQALGVAGV